MVSSAIKEATRIQVGKETTRGTAVAATRKLLVKDATYRRIQDLEAFEGQMHDTLARVTQAPVVTREGTEFEVSTDLDFEQILLFRLSGMKGAVTPSTPVAMENQRLWTFTPSVTTDPLPDTYTIEFVESNMDATPDDAGMETPYGFTVALEIVAGVDGISQINASMVGRKTSDTTPTASLALPTVEYTSGLEWACYVDGTWANLGTTQISGQIYGFTWRFHNFLAPSYHLDGRDDKDFSQYQFTPREVDLTMDVVHDPTSTALVQTEEANKTNGTARFIQLKLDGPDMDSRPKQIILDGCYYHESDSMQDRGQDRDGNMITRLHLKSAYDSTQAQDIQVSVENILTAFP